MFFKLTKNNKKGFAMLFAVLVSSLLISIGLSIYNISVKSLSLASSEKDSEGAYYSGISAMECALYWDNKGVFPEYDYAGPNGSVGPYNISNSTTTTVTCNGRPITLSFNCVDNIAAGSGGACTLPQTDFFNYSTTTIDPQAPQSDIYIKITNTSAVIRAYGHNSSLTGRRAERGIQRNN